VDEDLPQQLPVAEVRRHQQRPLAGGQVRLERLPGLGADHLLLLPARWHPIHIRQGLQHRARHGDVRAASDGVPLLLGALWQCLGQVLQCDAAPDAQRVGDPSQEAREALSCPPAELRDGAQHEVGEEAGEGTGRLADDAAQVRGRQPDGVDSWGRHSSGRRHGDTLHTEASGPARLLPLHIGPVPCQPKFW
jgi:hypothetical protein